MKLLVLHGSARINGTGSHVTKWVADTAKNDERFSTELVHVADLDLPFFNEAFSPKYRHYSGHEYTNPHGKAWAKKVAEADAFIFVTPEYNHSVPAALKNALDWVGMEWANKPVGFVGYSGVPYGGVRAVEHLRQIAPELGLVQAHHTVLVGHAPDRIAEDGTVSDEFLVRALPPLLDEIYHLATVLVQPR